MTVTGAISRAKAPLAHRLLARSQRGDGVGVLRLAGELVALGAILGEGAHQAALVVGVLQPVEEHVVDHLAVAHAGAGAALRSR